METTALKNSAILIVDDHEANVLLFQRLLEREGYTRLKTTTDSRQVLSLYAEFQPELILLDLMMPHLNGFEVMEKLRPLIPPETFLPILVLTADVTTETKQKALSMGANDFVTKPFDHVEVLLRIHNLLETRLLHRELANQNLILEERVRERTAEIRLHAARAEALVHTAARLNAQLDLNAVLSAVCEETVRALNAPAAGITLYDEQHDVLYHAADFGLPPDYRQRAHPTPRAVVEEYAQRMGPIVSIPDIQAIPGLPDAELYAVLNIRSVVALSMRRNGKLVGTLNILTFGEVRHFTDADLALLRGLADQAVQAISNARLFEQEQQRRAELGALYDLARALADTDDLGTILDLVTRRAVETVHVTFAGLALIEGNDLVICAAFPVRILDRDLQVGNRLPLATHPCCQRGLEQNAATILRADSPEIGAMERADLFLDIAQTVCLVPLCVGDPSTRSGTLGLLLLGEARGDEREPFTEGKFRLMHSIGDQAASALHRATLHAQTERQFEHLAALHTIDTAITGSLDLRLILDIFLEQAVTQLHVDAIDILLLNPLLHTLEYTAGRGFRTNAIERTRLFLGEEHAGRVALERRIINVPNLSETGAAFIRAPLLKQEGFIAYCGAPLVAKGEVKGVLEIFQRSQLDPDPEWLNFLQMLAEQAVIALDNAQMLALLQLSNSDLRTAYEATIEGWSHALDLRDKETEGHTQRVTEMTEQLARAIGLSDAELVHVRRGALLHDIGKMGVPDGILLKPGKLTDEEWVKMRMHPVFAYELLSPIAYLRPALDIPYCHHEKWDGTGYPRGLKGEQIPLVARLFAVIDVWDALTSDRPYRPAWTKELTREHIQSLSGTHFDPKMVEMFMTLIANA